MSLNRVAIPSPNVSSRKGAAVRLIVLHSSEGATTYQSLGNYFGNPSSQASSHVGIDDTPGTIGEYVRRDDKAWTASNANPVAVQAELCCPSGASDNWSVDEWHAHPVMLQNTATWIAEEAAAFGIPIVGLTASQAQGGSAGVCQHADLGSWGGGHHDCGNNFPIDEVIAMAGGQPAPTPAPPTSGTAPAFPYPAGHYLGQPDPDPQCHSGYYGDPDTSNVRAWQAQMAARGWNIGVDGCYGAQSQSIATQFQQEKGLAADGLTGPETWAATWTSPIT